VFYFSRDDEVSGNPETLQLPILEGISVGTSGIDVTCIRESTFAPL